MMYNDLYTSLIKEETLPRAAPVGRTPTRPLFASSMGGL
jgi:hypothetical protein